MTPIFTLIWHSRSAGGFADDLPAAWAFMRLCLAKTPNTPRIMRLVRFSWSGLQS